MDCCGILGCPASWKKWLPQETLCVDARKLAQKRWKLLVVTEKGCRHLLGKNLSCRILLIPGICAPEILSGVKAEFIITYGLSPRDSLTLSSLQTPVLCVQRTLPATDESSIEPQEIPLSHLPAPAENLLPLLGLYLLQTRLTGGILPW